MTLLQPPDVKAGDFYGSSIHVNGNHLLVGAPGRSWGDPQEGYVDSYRRIDGEWVFHSRISQPVGRPSARFGEAVMSKGGYVYITAPNYIDSVSNTHGAIFVFSYINEEWVALGIGSGDSFGFSQMYMTMFESSVAIGNYGPLGYGGAVYVYGIYGTNFITDVVLQPDPIPGTQFNQSFYGASVDGVWGRQADFHSRVVVGAPYDQEPEHWSSRGAVHIYEFVFPGIWIETTKILAPVYAYAFGTTIAAAEFRTFITQINYAPSEAAVSVYKIENDQWVLEKFLEFPNHIDTWGPALALKKHNFRPPDMLVGSINCIRPILPSSSCQIMEVAKVYAIDHETQQWEPKLSLRYDGFAPGYVNATVARLEDDFAILGFPQLDEPYENAGAVLVFNGLSGADNNNNGLPDACDIPGDASGDGFVNVTDLLILLSTWGPCSACPADFNADRVVNVSDLLAIFGNWG